MKLITINVEDQQHTAIKLAATKAGVSIKEYLLGERPKEPTLAFTASDEDLEKIHGARHKDGVAEIRPCKHGADPRFCRYAKSGKPCK